MYPIQIVEVQEILIEKYLIEKWIDISKHLLAFGLKIEIDRVKNLFLDNKSNKNFK